MGEREFFGDDNWLIMVQVVEPFKGTCQEPDSLTWRGRSNFRFTVKKGLLSGYATLRINKVGGLGSKYGKLDPLSKCPVLLGW